MAAPVSKQKRGEFIAIWARELAPLGRRIDPRNLFSSKRYSLGISILSEGVDEIQRLGVDWYEGRAEDKQIGWAYYDVKAAIKLLFTEAKGDQLALDILNNIDEILRFKLQPIIKDWIAPNPYKMGPPAPKPNPEPPPPPPPELQKIVEEIKLPSSPLPSWVVPAVVASGLLLTAYFLMRRRQEG